MNSSVTCVLDGDVAVVHLDDGRANALSVALMDELADTLAGFTADTRAVVLTGRAEVFSAGLDRALTVPGREQDLERAMVRFAYLLATLLLHPRPVVAAVNGHALAAGCLLAFCADRVIASAGDHRWGLVETRVGVAQAEFGLLLARYRLGAAADSWALLGERKTLEQAVSAGAVDRVARPDNLLGEALDEARALATIPASAFALTKQRLRVTLCSGLLASVSEGLPR